MLFVSISYFGVCYSRVGLSLSYVIVVQKKFHWRSKVSIILERENFFLLGMGILSFCLRAGLTPVLTIFELHVSWRHVGAVLPGFRIKKIQLYTTLWRKEEKGLLQINSLYNTKTTRNVFNIILWRLLWNPAFKKSGFWMFEWSYLRSPLY